MLKLEKRGKKGIFWVTGTLNGERYRESTRTNSRTHAQSILAKRQDQILDRAVFGEKKTTTFAECAALYMEQGGERKFLAPLIKRFDGMRMSEVTQAVVSRAAQELYPNQGLASRVRTVFTPLNAVVRSAHRAGMCELVIFEKPKFKTKPVKYADDRWFEIVLPYCGLRLAAIILFITLTGARVQEACDLLWREVDLDRREAILQITKGGGSRRVLLAPVLIQALTRLADEYGCQAGGRVFGYAARWSVNQAIERACDRANLAAGAIAWEKRISPKTGKTEKVRVILKPLAVEYLSSHKVGRHAFAARLLREGHSLKLVQEAGGWKVARMVTDHYGHLEPSQIDDAVRQSGSGLRMSDTPFRQKGSPKLPPPTHQGEEPQNG